MTKFQTVTDAPLPWHRLPILSTAQAIQFANCRSVQTFRRRMREWNVKPCARGQWSRLRIEAAMERAARRVQV